MIVIVSVVNFAPPPRTVSCRLAACHPPAVTSFRSPFSSSSSSVCKSHVKSATKLTLPTLFSFSPCPHVPLSLAPSLPLPLPLSLSPSLPLSLSPSLPLSLSPSLPLSLSPSLPLSLSPSLPLSPSPSLPLSLSISLVWSGAARRVRGYGVDETLYGQTEADGAGKKRHDRFLMIPLASGALEIGLKPHSHIAVTLAGNIHLRLDMIRP